MIDEEKLSAYMLEEVKIIQDIIKRMAYNSFLIKGWTITLVAAILLLKGKTYNGFIAFIPLFIFWYLDAYFLWQERMYRKLYDWVIENRLEKDHYLFNMKAKERFEDKVDSKFKIMLADTLLPFYGVITLITLIYLVLLLVLNDDTYLFNIIDSFK